MTRLIVIGGGPAGITAALEASALGAEVSLVSAEPVGGRANWHSLVPSKVYLTAADHLGESRYFSAMGLRGPAPEADLPALRNRISDMARAWSEHHQALLRGHGVTVLRGRARFIGGSRLQVDSEGAAPEVLTFDRAIVASGSEPVFSAQIKPDGQRILAPRLAGKLAEWPGHMIVIGGGVTGAEFTYFFNAMGRAVTWVTDLPALLPRTDPDVSAELEQAMQARGVTIVKSAPVAAVRAEGSGVAVGLQDGRTLAGTHAFIALGRRADVAGLALETAGVAFSAQGIEVDDLCRTSQPHIYAAGDAAGPPYVANRGQTQARVAARHAVGAAQAAFRPETVIEAVYTHPQVAQVGLTEAGAAAAGRPIRVYRADYRNALKPRLSADVTGFIKLCVGARDGRIVGAAAVGDRAAEILGPVAVAIAAEMKLDDLAAVFPAYPTLTEIVGIAARGY